MKNILGKAAVAKIHAAITSLFERARVRFFGAKKSREPKRLAISFGRPAEHRENLSLPGIFNAAAAAERMKPNEQLRESLLRIADGYLTVQEEHAKTQVVNAVQSFLLDAEQNKKKTDVKTVLGGELADIMGKVTENVKRIVDTESTKARNSGTIDAVSKIALGLGISDPTVAFIVVRDRFLCDECKRLHLLDDGTTPRVYKLSEVSHGYHKRGSDTPSIAGLHPHCRCSMVSILPGYGFDGGGSIKYISYGHDEYAKQRG